MTIPKDVLEKGKAIIRKQLKEEGLSKQPPVLTINVKEQYDADNDEMYKTGAVSIDLDFIRDGGLQDLQPTALKILMAIASHADRDGFTFVSQQTIAEEVGLRSRQQVAERIAKDLKDITIAGRVLLKSVMLTKSDGKRFCLYHVVNCKVIQETYNPDLDEQYDEDFAFEVEDADDYINEEKPEEAVKSPEAFIVETTEDSLTAVETVTATLEGTAEDVTTKTIEDVPKLLLDAKPDTVTGENKTQAETAPAKPVLNIIEKIRAEAETRLMNSSLTEKQRERLTIDADNDAVEALFESLLA